MATTVNFAHIADRAERDAEAVRQLEGWFNALNPNMLPELIDHAKGAEWLAKASDEGTNELAIEAIDELNMAIMIGGVSGLPYHAFCRKHCLTAYRLWMHDGADAVLTNEEGFAL